MVNTHLLATRSRMIILMVFTRTTLTWMARRIWYGRNDNGFAFKYGRCAFDIIYQWLKSWRLVTITGDVIMGKFFEKAEILMFFIFAQHKGIA